MVCLLLRRTHPLSCLALTRHRDNHVQYQTSHRHNVLGHVWNLMSKPRNRRSQIFIALTRIRFECVTDLPMHPSLWWTLLSVPCLQSPTAALEWQFAERSVINCIRNVRLWFVFSSIKFIVSNWLEFYLNSFMIRSVGQCHSHRSVGHPTASRPTDQKTIHWRRAIICVLWWISRRECSLIPSFMFYLWSVCCSFQCWFYAFPWSSNWMCDSDSLSETHCTMMHLPEADLNLMQLHLQRCESVNYSFSTDAYEPSPNATLYLKCI